MQKYLVLCGIVTALPIIAGRASYGQFFRPDYTFEEDAGGWLKFHRMPLSWEEAVLTCYYEDAILASPLNYGLKKHLLRLMSEHEVLTTMFSGISNIYSKSVYQSMEGIPISNIWLTWSSEPYRHETENCVAMNANSTMTEISCLERRPFACYRKEETLVTKGCSTLDTEYVLNNRTGSCYKLYREKHSWPEAYRICAAEGGHLAIVNSQPEAEVIWDLGIASGSNYALALGFREWGTDRTWITIKGQSLEEAGYDKWYTGEPNLLNENCGGFMFDGSPKEVGILADLPCHYKVMFICEIEPSILKSN